MHVIVTALSDLQNNQVSDICVLVAQAAPALLDKANKASAITRLVYINFPAGMGHVHRNRGIPCVTLAELAEFVLFFRMFQKGKKPLECAPADLAKMIESGTVISY